MKLLKKIMNIYKILNTNKDKKIQKMINSFKEEMILLLNKKIQYFSKISIQLAFKKELKIMKLN